jgi:hypothetical protein
MRRKSEANRLLLDGPDVARFLNEEKDRRDYAAVLKVFEMCRQLDELPRNKIHLLPPQNLEAPRTAEWNRNQKKVESLASAINDALGRFQFRPVLIVAPSPYWLGWKGANAVLGPRLSTESIVMMILRMTVAGSLSRVRQCFCGRWFFAETNKKVVCSDACRFQKFKQAHQDFNEQRAGYMRAYRSNPKVKSKRRKTHVKTK